MSRRAAALAFFCCGLAVGALAGEEGSELPAGDMVLRVGRLHDGQGQVLEPAWVVVRAGKVVSVGREPPAGHDDLPLLDRRHLVASPGLVAAQAVLGDGRREDVSASARFRALDGFDPFAERGRLLARGVTTAFLHPGRGRLATGEGCVVKLGGPPEARIVRARGEQCLELGEGAFGPPDRVTVPVPSSSDVPIAPAEPQRPLGPRGALPELEARIAAALVYDQAREAQPGSTRPPFDADLEALAEAVLEGRLRIDARRVEELRAALDLARRLGLEPVLAGASEAGLIAEELARAELHVVLELPLGARSPARDGLDHPDALRPRADTAARLSRAGVSFALAAPPGAELDLRLLAALAVRGGLERARALQAITGDAAKVLGVEARVGALAPGRDADLVLWSEDPLAARAEAVETWIEGRRVHRARGADAVVIRAGTVHTMAGEALRPGEVLVREGTIAAVGSSVPSPPGARVIDLGPGGVITPGLIDAYGHAGLAGDRGAADTSVPLHALVGRAGEDLLRLARAGVTTVGLTPWTLPAGGARIAAIKTAEREGASDLRGGMVVREIAGVVFDLRGMDPLVPAPQFVARLRAGKAYAARWRQYGEALARWEQQQKSGRSAPKPAPTPEPEPEATPKADPLSGTWTMTVSGGPLPEPQTGTLRLRLERDGVTVNGLARTPAAPDEVPVSGTLAGRKLSLVVEVQSPMGQPTLEAELVADDQLRGSVSLGPFKLNLEATRTERTPPEIQVRARPRSRGGRPVPPARDAGLEPWRRCFEGQATLFLHVDSALAAGALLELCRKERLSVVFVGLDALEPLAADLQAAGSGVVLRPEAARAWQGREEAWAVRAREAGVRVAFMSEAEDGAAELPERALLAVARGLSSGDALRALTVDAAASLGVLDRVGTLETGKDGDLVAWDGPPFDPTSRVRAVVVGGRVLEGDE